MPSRLPSAATHFQIAKAALEAGKDVFVEKPLGLDVWEGEELVSLVEKTRTKNKKLKDCITEEKYIAEIFFFLRVLGVLHGWKAKR